MLPQINTFLVTENQSYIVGPGGDTVVMQQGKGPRFTTQGLPAYTKCVNTSLNWAG